jgi:hypothetical protein
MRISKVILIATILLNLSQSLFAQDWYYDYGTAIVEGQPAASYGYQSGFVQLWGDNAIIRKYGNQQGGLRFGSADNLGASNWMERMRISDNGFVGIGTTAPSTMLHVNGDITAGPSNGGD